ncbi:Unknown protein, partial [Striga hermonthica]
IVATAVSQPPLVRDAHGGRAARLLLPKAFALLGEQLHWHSVASLQHGQPFLWPRWPPAQPEHSLLFLELFSLLRESFQPQLEPSPLLLEPSQPQLEPFLLRLKQPALAQATPHSPSARLFIMSFNPLSVILKENQLTGPNYIDWKRNLDIVLTAESYKYVLTEACPDVPADNAPDEEKQEYARWKKADEMAKCYILASMSNVLQHQHQSMATAADMLLNLKELFGHQSRAVRQEALSSLMNTRMAEGTPVRDHALKVMAQLSELEVLGGFIDGETQ